MDSLTNFFRLLASEARGFYGLWPKCVADPQTPPAGFRALFSRTDGWLSKDSNGLARRVDFEGSTYFKIVTLAQFTANQNDLDVGEGTIIEISSDAVRNVTGLAGGTNGRLLIFANVGSFNIRFMHEDAGSAAANRLKFSTAANLLVRPDEIVAFLYFPGISRWRWWTV